MTIERNFQEMEQARERYWRAHPASAAIKLRWRATTVRHCFHVLPGERILEIGAGSGLWTRHLAAVLKGRNPITAAVFNQDLRRDPAWETPVASAQPTLVESLDELPDGSFDYVVGTAILSHDQYAGSLKAILRLLKPGGQILFFEANRLNPQVFLKTAIPALGRRLGHASCQIGISRYRFLRTASHQGFVNIDVIPYDIIHPALPAGMIRALQSLAFVFEQTPIIRELCGTLYLWAQKPGTVSRPAVNLGDLPQFQHAVSFVIPCYNEEMNVGPLVHAVRQFFDSYIYEILIVNDNSRDRTAEVTRELAAADSRIRLIDRVPPNGVGRALRDGYQNARGAYILTMDCDFVQTVPELRDLFEAAAAGYDGAIGSRFTHDSIMVNYPFLKILCNRLFHLLANVTLPCHVHDISNNLKLFRADVLKSIPIQQPHFAANAETGLKPILAGYRVAEVPVSWINRTAEMGTSSFRILRVGPNYLLALWDVLRSARQLAAARQDQPAKNLTFKAHQ